jgi:exodeoxyribonuclease VII large subunit
MVELGNARRRPVYSPSSLNRLIKSTLEDVFPLLEVEGEIGSFRPAASGHWYFVLKDSTSELKISMFRSRAVLCRNKPVNGDKVLVRGRLGVYEPRGEYQLIAEFLEPAGMGEKLLALLRLREQLTAEGLLDPKSKRALPRWPRSLWVLSSAQGAALRDVLSVIARRFPMLPVSVWPVQVQGEDAARQLRDALLAIAAIPLQQAPDVLLITRGGGSQEDLWTFNDEALARQVAAMPMPVVAAIGHEIDTTLVELVADLRAATPTAAAELLTPDAEVLRQRLLQLRTRLVRTMHHQLETSALRLDTQRARLDRMHPETLLQRQQQLLVLSRQRLQGVLSLLLGESRNRLLLANRALRAMHPAAQLQRHQVGIKQLRWHLQQSLGNAQSQRAHRLVTLRQRLLGLDPRSTLRHAGQTLHNVRQRLGNLAADRIAKMHERLGGVRRTLHAISPQATLDRGYAMVFDRQTGALLTRAEQCNPAARLRLQLADGSVNVKVDPKAGS